MVGSTGLWQTDVVSSGQHWSVTALGQWSMAGRYGQWWSALVSDRQVWPVVGSGRHMWSMVVSSIQ